MHLVLCPPSYVSQKEVRIRTPCREVAKGESQLSLYSPNLVFGSVPSNAILSDACSKKQLQDLALSAETVLAPACACTHYVPGVMTPNLIRLGADLQEGFCLNLH